MMGHFSLKRDTKIALTVGGVFTAALAAVLLSTSSGTTMAVAPNIVSDRPLSETSQILKIKDVAILKSASADSNIDLQAVPNGLIVSFMAKNNGQKSTPINVDS